MSFYGDSLRRISAGEPAVTNCTSNVFGVFPFGMFASTEVCGPSTVA
ncbi:MAG: hypothetical protein IPH65_12705 [Dehalococcoidia bacterium]|nr:hypothetical protein [Dehalococcoidia bacterium]